MEAAKARDQSRVNIGYGFLMIATTDGVIWFVLFFGGGGFITLLIAFSIVNSSVVGRCACRYFEGVALACGLKGGGGG